MNIPNLRKPNGEFFGVRTIGLPRGLLYYRYSYLWKAFFTRLGFQYQVSRPTDKRLLAAGVASAIDETCLSCKIYFGHVADLIGRCDAIFVPRISGFGSRARMCTRFEALPDLTANVFTEQSLRIVDMNVDWANKIGEEEAYIDLGLRLGRTRKEVKEAYRYARRIQDLYDRDCWKNQQKAAKEDGMKILLAGHGYLLHDPYEGGQIAEILTGLGASVLYTDETDKTAAFKRSKSFTSTMPWQLTREIVGSILMLKDRVDGVVLISAFPCSPDSMSDDMIVRKIKDIPILQLTMDVQDGSAGLETRLESFVDILHYKKEDGYGR